MKRYYTSWLYSLLLASFTAASVQSMFEESRVLNESRATLNLLAESIEESLASSNPKNQPTQVARTIRRYQARQHLAGIAVCSFRSAPNGEVSLVIPSSLGAPASFSWEPLCLQTSSLVNSAPQEAVREDWTATRLNHRFQYLAMPIAPSEDLPRQVLILARDLSFVRGLWFESFSRTFLLCFAIGIVAILLIAAQMQSWLRANFRSFHQVLRGLIAGRKPRQQELGELTPLSHDLNRLAEQILSLKLSAQRGESMGDHPRPPAKRLVVIANREPYIHQHKDGKIEVMRPASGLVTGLEPILKQSGGLWIAHGGGSADYDVTNADGEVPVPPERPRYTLKRIRLAPEEEEGYYYGFSNEGLWPLCHLAHTRPIFRLSDWQQYVAVNQKFADAIPVEALGEDSIFLVQDYHFALLPRLLQMRAEAVAGPRRAKVGIFWHIPWPNPEAFGICPWNRELLEGMLGADVIGFHTQYHCNNFLEACNRYLEARIDLEHFTVTRHNHETRIRAFPIGIDTAPVRTLSDSEREELKKRYGIRAEILAVGVDRIDYTKGIIERVEAVERFLEKNPEYIGKFSLVQMGSPSRTHIPAYQLLFDQLQKTVDRVNQKFSRQTGSPEGYQPVLFIPHHHEWSEIQYFFQLGDICMVTSLHDGMNLVAKEYVWCQRPDRGALILSKFTGASRELTEAFIVNPYSIEEMADAIAACLALSNEERKRRMTSMKEKVQTRNAFKWASELIDSLIEIDTEPGYAQESGHSKVPSRNTFRRRPKFIVSGGGKAQARR